MDSGLYRVKNDGTGLVHLRDHFCASAPIVEADWFIYFRGKKNELFRQGDILPGQMTFDLALTPRS